MFQIVARSRHGAALPRVDRHGGGFLIAARLAQVGDRYRRGPPALRFVPLTSSTNAAAEVRHQGEFVDGGDLKQWEKRRLSTKDPGGALRIARQSDARTSST